MGEGWGLPRARFGGEGVSSKLLRSYGPGTSVHAVEHPLYTRHTGEELAPYPDTGPVSRKVGRGLGDAVADSLNQLYRHALMASPIPGLHPSTRRGILP